MGRRRPFFLIGAIGCSVILFLIPFVSALWMAVLALWLLDAANNTAMEPYRAFISDMLPKSQLARGFLTQSMFVGFGAVAANLSIFVFQQLIDGQFGALPLWVYSAFWLGAVCSIGSVLISVLSTKEFPPTEEELAELRAKPRGLVASVREIADAVRVMPKGMHKIGLVFLFQWYAMFVYWQFVTVSMGATVWNAGPDDPAYEQAAGWTGLANGAYNLVTMFAAFGLMGMAARFGAKKVHAGALLIAAVSLVWFSQITNQYLLFIPMIGLGIAWASMMGVPYILVSSMVPKERTGVYMGIVNMMIVVPMLIETLTFGWIYQNLLGDYGPNAIIFAGVLLGLGGIAMLWVDPPPEDEESPLMPLGAPREISVYDQVIVGSDGSPASLHAVGHAAGIANAAEARLVVVSDYRDDGTGGDGGAESISGGGVGLRKELHGKEAAMSAVRNSLKELTTDRVRTIDTRVVPGDPASALLEVAGSNPRNLIVVGNRGLGAQEGELLGSVPAAVAKSAVCNVLIIQTTDNPSPTHQP